VPSEGIIGGGLMDEAEKLLVDELGPIYSEIKDALRS
jgi:hypothetical protein